VLAWRQITPRLPRSAMEVSPARGVPRVGLSAAIVACPAGPPGTAGMAAVAEIRATARPSPRREVLPSRCAARFPAGIFARPPRHGIHDAATSR